MSTRAIRFTKPLQLEIREGRKTVTRRTNLKWLKVRKGDRLRILQSGGLIVVATEDARLEHVQDITESDAIREAVENAVLASPLLKAEAERFEQHVFKSDRPYVTPRAYFAAYWDAINGDKPGLAFEHNPKVVVINFGLPEAE